MSDDYLDRTRIILAKVFDIPKVQVLPDSTIDSLGRWDSHKFLFIVLALEEEFDIEFEPEDVEEMLTVESVAEIIKGHCERD